MPLIDGVIVTKIQDYTISLTIQITQLFLTNKVRNNESQISIKSLYFWKSLNIQNEWDNGVRTKVRYYRKFMTLVIHEEHSSIW